MIHSVQQPYLSVQSKGTASARGSIEGHANHIGILRCALRRQLQVQAIGALLEPQFHIIAQQGSRPDALTSRCLRQRVNYSQAVSRPSKSYRIQQIAFGREAKVLGFVGSSVGIVKRACCYLRRAFSINSPWASAVNRLSVYAQPCADV